MATKRRVRDMLLRLKTPVEIQDTEFYKRLTIRINHQGVSVRDTEIGAKIGTKSQFRVRAGDFILSKIDARQGAFGIVPPEADDGIITGNFWTYRVDNQLVDTEWFLQFTNSDAFLDLCKRSSTGNTHRKYLNEAIFLNHELAIPSLEEQRKAFVSCKAGNKRVEEVQHEITHQQSLLAKLKQAILQEAIQGKLTADWRAAHPDVEPASQFLHRIQAEKARLIAAKKLRPEKSLPQITPAEIPFEIPKGWEWCRLKELGRWCGGGTPTKDVDRFWGDEVPWITPKDMKQPFLSDSQLKLTRIGVEESAAKLIPAKSILFVVRGMILAHTFPVSVNLVETTVNQDMKALMPYLRGLEVFLRLLLESSSQRILSVVTKSTHGTRKLETEVYENFVIPLPPLAEQAAIVERVEALMTTCRLLEAEIAASRTHAAHLLQAVLKEAFAPAAKVAA